MIDNLALGLSHGLMILAAWRLLSRADLDDPQAQAGEKRKAAWGVKNNGGARPDA